MNSNSNTAVQTLIELISLLSKFFSVHLTEPLNQFTFKCAKHMERKLAQLLRKDDFWLKHSSTVTSG